MKKLISAAIAVVMFAAMLVGAVSAEVLWTDNFDGGFNELDWTLGGTLFTLEQNGPTSSPHLEGWAEAVVQQSTYGDEAPAPRVYGSNVAFKCDTWFFGDGGNESDDHWVGLWWADYFYDLDAQNRVVYTVRVNYDKRTVILSADGVGEGETFFPEYTEVAVWQMPESIELEMDESAPTVFSIGMRINGTQVDGFFNDMKVVSFTAPTMHQFKSPLIFWNNQCHTGYDNWMVSTADYDLFNEGAAQNDPAPAQTEAAAADNEAPAGDDAAAATEKVVEKENVVVGTDADGSAVTEVVTKEVARPAANTGAKTTGGNAAKTGDAAIIVIAVMLTALGAAIVVKKTASRGR